PALDGLRALAVGAVLAYHLGRLRGGFLGVDLFFVISGYLITSLLLVEVRSSGRISLAGFWKRRFRRLLPALLLVLAAVVLASHAWFPAWRRNGVRVDALAALGYVGNWRFVLSKQSYFASGVGPSPLRHVWSLAIEEQFYLVWPLVVVGVVVAAGRKRLRGALTVVAGVGTVASIAWMAVLGGGSKDPSRAYYGTDTRAFTILIGVLLAVALAEAPERPRTRQWRMRRRRIMSAASVPALVAASVFVVVADNQRHWMYRGGFVAFSLLGALLVAGCVADRGWLVAVLAWRPLRWVGRVSYGIYLWSWPVQTFAEGHFGLTGWRLDAWVVGVVVGAAALSARFVERPFRTGRLFADRPDALRRMVPVAGIALTAVIVLAATAGATKEPDFLHVSDSAASAVALRPAKPPPAAITVPSTVATTVAPATVPGITAPPTVPPTTLPPSLGRPVRIMVTGDSVGWSLGWGIKDGTIANAEIDDRGLIGCGVMPQALSKWITAAEPDPQGYYVDCPEQPQAEAIGLQGRPDAVVLSAGTWEIYDQEYLGKRWRVGTKAYGDLLTELLQDRIN
ncbi:MAG TPA: acyltransferase, partial [Acidimicrobiales bacterium]